MTSSEETTDDPPSSITLTITTLDLPESKADRQSLLEDLQETLTDQLRARLDQPVSQITGTVGQQYPTVSPTCPDCGDSLDLQGIYVGDGPDAFAVARCAADCGWTGDAVFKLTDLDRRVDDGYESAVLAGAVTPDYQPYANREP